ncbi:BLUF domain-containing protein [Roseivirga sp. BDSF3-8]|uniref:BLUF domain-containing protein n=1 Tax=Roseivirga sp. BDSF3-8 TaxID=3241598 RepID=UPI003531A840
MLSNLVYVSNRKPNCSPQDIDQILSACIRNNKKQDITGVLLYSEQKFVQYLEGDYKTIMSLYDKIKLDQRHSNAVLISSGPITDRTFPSWQMGCKKLDLKSVEFDTAISKDDRVEFQNVLSGKESNRAMTIISKLFY